MNPKQHELSFYVKVDGERQLHRLTIGCPENEDGSYFCRVRFEPRLTSTKKIFGSSAAQAWSLAIGFVDSLIDGQMVTDDSDEELDVKSYFESLSD